MEGRIMELMSDVEWADVGAGLAPLILSRAQRCLAAYAEDPTRIEEDARKEIAAAEGGYGRKQIHELVQNAADAMLGAPGRIEVRLTPHTLYVANQGHPVDESGVEALLYSHMSRKSDDEIGRFGLGFKSVTAISDAPAFFSRSGSFGFDRARAEHEIRRIKPDAPLTPGLRLAWPLSPRAAAEDDDVLAEMMTWATTVVRVPVVRNHGSLAEELAAFPAEFVLFSPHVESLTLVAPDGEVRHVSATDHPDGTRVLRDGRAESRWRVFSREHRPSALALQDAGTVRGRDVITVTWAVPLGDRSSLGQFWAHFPINDRTSLSGILNAPWKLTEDRVSILEGAYNEEILAEVVPELVAESLPVLHEAFDGVDYIDLLPSRPRETEGWADATLNEPIFVRLRRTPSLMGTDGRLHEPATMAFHPEGLPRAWKELWMRRPAPGTWLHHDVDATEARRVKAMRLLATPGSIAVGLRGWLEALTADRAPEGSALALALVGEVVETGTPEQAEEARSAEVVVREDGATVAPDPGRVFVRTDAGETGDFVHPDVAADEEAADALRRLGIGPLDPTGRLRRQLVRALGDDSDFDGHWAAVWDLTCDLDATHAAQVLRDTVRATPEEDVRVRTLTGGWRALGEVLRPGVAIAGDVAEDRDWLLDERFHHPHLEVLELLGLTDRPRARTSAPPEPWLGAYEEHMRSEFARGHGGKVRPQSDRIAVEGPTSPLYPMQMLPLLSATGRASFTAAALRVASTARWSVFHRSNASYGRKTAPSPDYWWLSRHGMLRTALGPWPVTKCLLPTDVESDVELADFLPIPRDEILGDTRALGIRTRIEELEAEDWVEILQAGQRQLDDRRLALLYAWASDWVTAPPAVVVPVGRQRQPRPPAEVAVTENPGTYAALQRGRVPSLLVPSSEYVAVLVEEWGMRDASDLVGVEYVYEVRGESELLLDRFPSLRNWLESGEASGIEILECESIEQVITTPAGRDSTWRESATTAEGRVLFTAEDRAEALRQIGEELDLGLEPEDIRAILDQEQAHRSNALVQRLREASDDLERLVIAIGEDALRRVVPSTVLAAVAERGEEPGPRDLARLAMAIHGHNLLAQFAKTLTERGLDAPERWNGSARARRFVADLGFGPGWAGFADDGERGATLAVTGPARPKPLHDYQQHVAENIRAMIRGEGPGRGLVALPTGAGKTRVAVQALTESLTAGELRGPIIWIAQTDELCEQAVQTWASMWRAFGQAEVDLVLSRFWGSNTIAESPEGPQVVVTTPQTLKNASASEAYQWLTAADMVVVDEAHRSVAPTYNAVLDWLGRGRSRRERRLLLGLTATPFRGTSESETLRLARRYDDNRLERGAFGSDMYRELQEMGILARVNQRVLGGSRLELTHAELEELRERHLLPRGVEQRLGRDLERNRTIVEDVVSLPEDWPVLLFATSVDNAEALAAHLAYLGVPAAAISGTTPSAQRRAVIRQFKDKELRVLTNYGVLAEGFDVPGVRAVYVARPTWSPNLYQQMIGRGLRGPRNGGSEIVDIVNVEDNVAEFGEQLAFNHFEHLWSGRS